MSRATSAEGALPVAAARPRLFSWAFLGVLPFFLFAFFFLILPTSFLMVGAFQDAEGRPTLANIRELFHPTILQAYWISIQVSTSATTASAPTPNRQTTMHDATPVSASISGYWIEIGALQPRQRPPCTSHDTSGTFSYQRSTRPHFGQCDGLSTMPGGGSPSGCGSSRISRASRFHANSSRGGRRRMTTLRKLPTSRPNKRQPALKSAG